MAMPYGISASYTMAGASEELASKILGDIPHGTHFCLFYETEDDLLGAAVAYFKAGLKRNEFCIWAISEPLSVEKAKDALSKGIPGFDRHLANHSIEIVPAREWYLDGNDFDLTRVIDGWKEKLRNALARGHSALCVSGNAFWLGTTRWNEFCAYERDLQKSIVGQRMSALCTYPLSESTAADVLEVTDAHHFAIAIRKGNLEFIDALNAEAQNSPLTPREREVLAWVRQGKTAREIGHILRISKRTVDEHVQIAIRKLGAANRTHAVAIAMRDQLFHENKFEKRKPAKKYAVR